MHAGEAVARLHVGQVAREPVTPAFGLRGVDRSAAAHLLDRPPRDVLGFEAAPVAQFKAERRARVLGGAKTRGCAQPRGIDLEAPDTQQDLAAAAGGLGPGDGRGGG
jgi:hypothetical protein